MESQVKNKNSKELELKRLSLLPYLGLVNHAQIARDKGITTSAVSYILRGLRTDRSGVVERATEVITLRRAEILAEANRLQRQINNHK